MGWIFGIILFALDVWAIASVINSRAEQNAKIIWVLVIAVLPFLGLAVWYFAGPKAEYS